MKTQISRNSHNAKKHYSGVYQQQGRMITDSDWNELVDATKERIAQALNNIIGSGVPRNKALEIYDDAGTKKIRPGHVYVNGILAQLESDTAGLEFDEQPDLPLPDGAAPGVNSRIYADVWERAVVSLEDGALRDPGLHGADTCSRSQTMLQLKWCDDGIDPEADSVTNPQVGNAELEVVLPDFAADVSLADPCLTEAVDQPRIGNYLFRLELHRLDLSHNGSTTTATVTLKWSTENGAEHYGLVWRNQDGAEQRDTSQLPPEFSAGSWVYEFYTASSEKHLGNHLTGDYTPLHGVLRTDLNTIPSIGAVQADYVRRWDGYIEFSMSRDPGQPWTPDTGSVTGVEKGQNIQPIEAQLPAHAWFSDDGDNASLDLVLQGLILKLRLNDSNFVRGDHWLAVVREGAAYYQATAEDGRVRRLNDGLPLGVVHHYLTLAELDGSGDLIAYESGSAKDRRLDFPPLSNLTADRVGYDPTATQARWEDIKEGPPTVYPNTVQEAVDDLVNNLESSDVGYELPGCGADQSVMNLLSSLVPAWPDLDNDTRTTIKDMITALLCHLDARTIPYTTAAPETLADVILNKLTGGDITGDLGINGNTDINGNLSVSGTTETNQLRMRAGVSGTPQENFVLTSEDANGNASWKPAPGAAWRLQADGGLVTDPALVTGNVGIGTESPTHALHVNQSVNNGFSVGLGGDGGRIWTEYLNNGPSLNFYDFDDIGAIRFRQSPNTDPQNPLPEHETDPEFEAVIAGRRGNIGINTTNPLATLHVNGQIYTESAVFSNQVLAETSPLGTLARGSSSFAAIPGLGATVFVPHSYTVNLVFSFTRLVLPQLVTGVTFRAAINNSTFVTIASFSSVAFSSNTFTNISRTESLNLAQGSNTVAIQWTVASIGQAVATLQGKRSMRISV